MNQGIEFVRDNDGNIVVFLYVNSLLFVLPLTSNCVF